MITFAVLCFFCVGNISVEKVRVVEELSQFEEFDDCFVDWPIGYARMDRTAFMLDRKFQLWHFEIGEDGLRPTQVTQHKGKGPGEISDPFYSFWYDNGLQFLHSNRLETLSNVGILVSSRRLEYKWLAAIGDLFVDRFPLFMADGRKIVAEVARGSSDVKKNSAGIKWQVEDFSKNINFVIDDIAGRLLMHACDHHVLVYNQTTVKDTIYLALFDLKKNELVVNDRFPLYGHHDPEEVKKIMETLPPSAPRPFPFVPLSGVTSSPDLGFVLSERTTNSKKKFFVVHTIDSSIGTRKILKIDRGEFNPLTFFIHMQGDMWAALDFCENRFLNFRLKP